MHATLNKTNIKHILFKYAPYVLLFLAVFLLYAKTISYTVTNNDDTSFIYVNADSYSSDSFIKDIFTNNVLFGGYTLYYRPLLTLSFAIDNKLAGQSPSFAHMTNIMLHIFSCFIIFFFFQRYLMNRTTALIAALIFAVHPANIYTAAWIPGRNDSILFIFFLAALFFLIEYLNTKKPKFLILHFFCFLAMLLTKESAPMLPVVFILYYLTHKPKEKHFSAANIGIIAIWAGEIILFFLLQKNAISATTSIQSSLANSFNLSNLSMLFEYFTSMFFMKVSFGVIIKPENFILGAIAIALTTYFAFFYKKNNKLKMFFYFMIPFIFIIPTILATRIWYQGNRMYIPLFAVLAICFVCFDTFYIKHKRYKAQVISVAFVFILLCSYITSTKSEVFKNELTFWSAVYNDSKIPSPVIKNRYSEALLRAGYPDEALPIIKDTLEKSGNTNLSAVFNLANYYFIKGDYAKAAGYFEQSAENPVLADAETYANLFICAKNLNNDDAAGYYYRQTVKKLNGSDEETNKLISTILKNLNAVQERPSL